MIGAFTRRESPLPTSLPHSRRVSGTELSNGRAASNRAPWYRLLAWRSFGELGKGSADAYEAVICR